MSMMYFDPIGSLLFLIGFAFVAWYFFKNKDKLKQYGAQATAGSNSDADEPLKKIVNTFLTSDNTKNYYTIRSVITLIYILLVLALLIFGGLWVINEKMDAKSKPQSESSPLKSN